MEGIQILVVLSTLRNVTMVAVNGSLNCGHELYQSSAIYLVQLSLLYYVQAHSPESPRHIVSQAALNLFSGSFFYSNVPRMLIVFSLLHSWTGTPGSVTMQFELTTKHCSQYSTAGRLKSHMSTTQNNPLSHMMHAGNGPSTSINMTMKAGGIAGCTIGGLIVITVTLFSCIRDHRRSSRRVQETRAVSSRDLLGGEGPVGTCNSDSYNRTSRPILYVRSLDAIQRSRRRAQSPTS